MEDPPQGPTLTLLYTISYLCISPIEKWYPLNMPTSKNWNESLKQGDFFFVELLKLYSQKACFFETFSLKAH